jgi:hypothetical protein
LYRVDGESVWNNTWIDLAAGASKRANGPYVCAKEGAHVAECVLDPKGVFSDRDPNNNRVKVSFTVAPKISVKKPPPVELKKIPPKPVTTRPASPQ